MPPDPNYPDDIHLYDDHPGSPFYVEQQPHQLRDWRDPEDDDE